MPWKPNPLSGKDGDWQPSVPLALNMVTHPAGGFQFNSIIGEGDTSAADRDTDGSACWAPSHRLVTSASDAFSQDEDDPTRWSVLQLMTTLRGWVGRPNRRTSSRPEVGAWGEGILGQLKAAELQERLTIRYFVSDINLELRHRPDSGSRNWLSVPPRTMVFWRGQIGYNDATGQPWYLVYKLHRGELYSGFVPANFLRSPTPLQEGQPVQKGSPGQVDPIAIPAITEELELLWRKLWSEEERIASYQAWFDMQNEIEDLVGMGPWSKSVPSDLSLIENPPASIVEAMDTLLHPPWFQRNGPPPSFLGRFGAYAISSEIQRALREIVFYIYRLQGPVSSQTWGIIGRAFGIPAADAYLQVLQPDLWNAAYPATTESGLPLSMSVLPTQGVYLRPQPDQVQNLETAPFLGISQGEEVTVVGDYHLIENGEGQPQILFLVNYLYANGRTYRGWVPAESLGTRLVSLTPELILWDGPFNTLGYRDGIEPWAAMGYHTYGQAQFLNLRAIFRNLGWGSWLTFPNRHLNLCGQLATMEAMNVSLEEGFRVFASTTLGLSILQDVDLGTSPDDLVQFIESLGWDAELHFGTSHLTPFLSSNQIVLALVASTNGHVRHDGSNGHWVHIHGVDEDQGLVRFYNPLFNQDQELESSEFNAAWERTDEAGITNVDRIFVTAHP